MKGVSERAGSCGYRELRLQFRGATEQRVRWTRCRWTKDEERKKKRRPRRSSRTTTATETAMVASRWRDSPRDGTRIVLRDQSISQQILIRIRLVVKIELIIVMLHVVRIFSLHIGAAARFRLWLLALVSSVLPSPRPSSAGSSSPSSLSPRPRRQPPPGSGPSRTDECG